MKLLKVSDPAGLFLAANGDYVAIDKITKEDLLRMVGQTLDQDEIELDPFDDQSIKNQAHQVIYKSVCQKLSALRARRKEFVDESSRLFLEDYERYRE